MQPTSLTKALISDPSGWQLALGLTPAAIDVVAYSPHGDGGFLSRRLDLNPEAQSPFKAVEDVVYDNPLLLCDFERVTVCLDPSATAIVPPSIADDEEGSGAVMKATVPGFDGEVIAEATGAPNAAVLTGVATPLASFLRRTFFNPVLTSPLTSLARYFVKLSRRANRARVLGVVDDRGVYVVGVDRGRLLACNRFDCTSTTDMAYYLAVVAETQGLAGAELLLAGAAEPRAELMKMLGGYFATVMPLIFPGDIFRIGGREAMEAPFHLVILPLCE